jgi:hypothetical protein
MTEVSRAYVSRVKQYARLLGMAACVVSFVDTDGIRHKVEVEAESLFKAAALAVRTSNSTTANQH